MREGDGKRSKVVPLANSTQLFFSLGQQPGKQVDKTKCLRTDNTVGEFVKLHRNTTQVASDLSAHISPPWREKEHGVRVRPRSD